MTVKVLIYPRGSNPYQELLYTRFKTSEYLVKYLDSASRSHVLGLIILPLQLIYYRVVGYTVFHIHWLHTFQLYQNLKIFHNLPFKIVYTGYFYFVFLLIRILNYKIVWTAHDLVARQNQFVNNLSISRFLASISDAVIVHSRKSISEMEIMQIKPRKVCVIPIGNYCNAYPNTVTKSKARKLLGIKPSTFVYGHFGRIEYYKGVLELIDAFSVINLTDIKLVIAGPCTDYSFLNTYQKMKFRII